MPREKNTRQEIAQQKAYWDDIRAARGRPAWDEHSSNERLMDVAMEAVKKLDIEKLLPLLAFKPELARWRKTGLIDNKKTLLLGLAETVFSDQRGGVKKGLACLDALLALSDLQARDPEGYTALDWMIKSGNTKGFSRLLAAVGPEKPVDRPQGKSSDGWGKTPLMIAVGRGNSQCAKDLLKEKANIHTLDDDGRNALTLAVLGNDEQCVALLLPHYDPTAKDRSGHTTLYYAVKYANEGWVQHLRLQARKAGKEPVDTQKSIDLCVLQLRKRWVRGHNQSYSGAQQVNPNGPFLAAMLAITDGFADLIPEPQGVEMVQLTGAQNLPRLAARLEQLELQRELGLPTRHSPDVQPSHGSIDQSPATSLPAGTLPAHAPGPQAQAPLQPARKSMRL